MCIRDRREIDAARVTARLGVSLNSLGRGEQAVVRLREVLATLEETTAPPDVLADLQATLGGALAFTGHVEESAEPLERALVLAQHYELAEPLAAALVRDVYKRQGLCRPPAALLRRLDPLDRRPRPHASPSVHRPSLGSRLGRFRRRTPWGNPGDGMGLSLIHI